MNEVNLNLVSKPRLIPASIRVLLVPIIALVGAVALAIVAFQIGFSKTSELRAQVATSKQAQTTLMQKQETLSEISTIAQAFSSSTLIALPPKSSVLTGLSQIKQHAEANSVAITDISVGASAGNENGVSSGSIKTTLAGDVNSIINFVLTISTLSPVMTLEKAELNLGASSATAEIDFKTYWATLPTKIPSITEKIDKLSTEELALLQKISELTQPAFSDITPGEATQRENPFTF